jgi:thioredoxin
MSAEALRSEDFDTTISDNDIVVIDFWAPWCGPCKSFAPIFERAAAANPDLKFVKVNTDEEQSLAGHFGIRSIPTLMIFRERVIVFQQAGALPAGALDDLLSQVRALDMNEVRRGAQPYDPDGDSADGQQTLQ